MTGSEMPVVLIVEDEPDVAETYNLWLADGYEVRMAQSGDEGLAELDETVENLLKRSQYHDLLQEYYSLVEKQATLEATKSTAELADNEAYVDLRNRVDDLETDLGDTLGGIDDDEDFIATLRGLSDVEE